MNPDLGSLAFIALFFAYTGWWFRGWREHERELERKFWRRVAQRELDARGPNPEWWT